MLRYMLCSLGSDTYFPEGYSFSKGLGKGEHGRRLGSGSGGSQEVNDDDDVITSGSGSGMTAPHYSGNGRKRRKKPRVNYIVVRPTLPPTDPVSTEPWINIKKKKKKTEMRPAKSGERKEVVPSGDNMNPVPQVVMVDGSTDDIVSGSVGESNVFGAWPGAGEGEASGTSDSVKKDLSQGGGLRERLGINGDIFVMPYKPM